MKQDKESKSNPKRVEGRHDWIRAKTKTKNSEIANKRVEKRDEAKNWFFETFNKREKTNC